ncbi:MAG: hypothetical protein GC162_12165 [Planctomycetes bacterium]|nr:hypothetical protein [Planctomycetota bacterium]
MLATLAHILSHILAPVLAITAAGAVVQRFKAMNVESLVRLNLYLFVPAFLFVSVAESKLTFTNIGLIGVAVLGPMALLAMPIYFLLRARKASGNTIAAVVVGGLFFNAGNFGIPVALLAFGAEGGAVEALVVMYLNTTVFMIGYGVLSVAQGHGLRAALGYFKLPMIYMIVAAFAVRQTGYVLPFWIDKAVHTVAEGMVPVALITLGAQLAMRARWPRWPLIGPVMIIKLLVMPVVTAGLVYILGLWPWPGAQLILAASGPTAVNTLLLTIELDGDAETAADCVFWTTLACALTVTLTLWLLHLAGGAPPAL